mmetsp:Transcript_5619/g.14428  ORF Transcript_5619/g.14428 Transcript_5619/m.14428 type:complete len:224 (-) Transcript_5619:55-726(-)
MGPAAREVRFSAGSDGPQLQGVLLRPSSEEDAAPRNRALVIVTHPHSKLGGDLYNNVVQAVGRHLARGGFQVLLFNFRGVGDSGGSATWTGSQETADVAAAVKFARAQDDVDKVFLVGYSFGGAVGCAAAHEGVDAYVAISYPYGYLARCALGRLYGRANASIPKMFIVGDGDQFASASGLSGFVERLQEPKQWLVFQNVDHFWLGSEHLLLEPISTFLTAQL